MAGRRRKIVPKAIFYGKDGTNQPYETGIQNYEH